LLQQSPSEGCVLEAISFALPGSMKPPVDPAHPGGVGVGFGVGFGVGLGVGFGVGRV
jgi:hypothetical protein